MNRKIKFIDVIGPAMPKNRWNVDVVVDNPQEEELGTIYWSSECGYTFTPSGHILTADELVHIGTAIFPLEQEASNERAKI